MFDLFVKELDYAKLVIQVKDKSGVDGSSIIGAVTTSIRTLLDSNTAEGVTLPILDKTDERGTIKLKLGFKPVPIDLLPVERLDSKSSTPGSGTTTSIAPSELLHDLFERDV